MDLPTKRHPNGVSLVGRCLMVIRDCMPAGSVQPISMTGDESYNNCGWLGGDTG